MVTTSSVAASSLSRSLEKVAVNVPGVAIPSSARKRSLGGAESASRTSEGRGHSFRYDGQGDCTTRKGHLTNKYRSSPENLRYRQEPTGENCPPIDIETPALPSVIPVDTANCSPDTADQLNKEQDPPALV